MRLNAEPSGLVLDEERVSYLVESIGQVLDEMVSQYPEPRESASPKPASRGPRPHPVEDLIEDSDGTSRPADGAQQFAEPLTTLSTTEEDLTMNVDVENYPRMRMLREIGVQPKSFEDCWRAIKRARHCSTREAMSAAVDAFPELHQAFLDQQPRRKR